MDDLNTQAANAEAEIDRARKRCVDSGYDAMLNDALWETFRRWLSHPGFDSDFNVLESTVLNELEFTLSDPHLRKEGWRLISELAARWERENNTKRKESLRIAIFEIAAEPPESPVTLELLFSLAADPETRWALFAAYENYPWRLRPHALKYSKGCVTEQDCNEWLLNQGYGADDWLQHPSP